VVPFSWSSPVPECGTVVGIKLPPDVRFAGEACRNEISALDHRLPTSALDGDTIM
jgi:hypothetical protein